LASSRPLGTILHGYSSCLEVSAGHNKHEYTTGTSWPMIMELFERHSKEEFNIEKSKFKR